jgi:hypothetical protein
MKSIENEFINRLLAMLLRIKAAPELLQDLIRKFFEKLHMLASRRTHLRNSHSVQLDRRLQVILSERYRNGACY